MGSPLVLAHVRPFCTDLLDVLVEISDTGILHFLYCLFKYRIPLMTKVLFTKISRLAQIQLKIGSVRIQVRPNVLFAAEFDEEALLARYSIVKNRVTHSVSKLKC